MSIYPTSYIYICIYIYIYMPRLVPHGPLATRSAGGTATCDLSCLVISVSA